MHAQDTSELFFDDVFVPHNNLLGSEEGRGFYQLMEQLAWERTSVALNCVVEMEEAVRVTTDYVRQRSAFGKPIAEFRSEEHTSELQSLMRISYAVFCLTTKIKTTQA